MKGLAVLTAVAVLATTGGAWAAGMTLTSRHLGAAAVGSPAFFPVSVLLTDALKGTTGRPDNGDIIDFVLSAPVDESSMCSGWDNSVASRTLTFEWSVVDGGTGNDTLQVTEVPAACPTGFHIGTVDLGSTGYDLSVDAIQFSNTDAILTVGATTSTLELHFGGKHHGTAGTVTSGSPAVWTPDPLLTDLSGHSCGVSVARTSSPVQF